MKLLTAAAIAATVAFAPAANAATTQIESGSGQRSLNISAFDPLGQIFTATDTDLQSFGFEIQTLNSPQANSALTLTLRQGGGLDGAILATRSSVFAGIPTTRTPTWIDFDLTGTTLVSGQSYTALLTSTSGRYGLIYGPDINLNNGQPIAGDAYLPGRFIVGGGSFNQPVCNTGICDANFRFTGETIAAPIPEPASWALMIGGFGFVGGALRVRARRVRFA